MISTQLDHPSMVDRLYANLLWAAYRFIAKNVSLFVTLLVRTSEILASITPARATISSSSTSPKPVHVWHLRAKLRSQRALRSLERALRRINYHTRHTRLFPLCCQWLFLRSSQSRSRGWLDKGAEPDILGLFLSRPCANCSRTASFSVPPGKSYRHLLITSIS